MKQTTKHLLVDGSIPLGAFLLLLIVLAIAAAFSGCNSAPDQPTVESGHADMAKPFVLSMHVFANPTMAVPAITVNYPIDFTLKLTGNSMDKIVNASFAPEALGKPSAYTATEFEGLMPWTNYEMTLLVTGPPERQGAMLTDKFVTHDVLGPQPDLGDNDSGQ